jgi:hypothetical protein
MELDFEEKIKLSKIIFYNYNERDKLDIGTKTIDLYFDNYHYKTIHLNQGTGEIANIDNANNLYDFGQEICFNNYNNKNEFEDAGYNNGCTKELNNDIKYASNLYEQCYETPYLPSGMFIKFQFISYYSDNNEKKNDGFYLGLKDIEIYNEEGINIIKNNDNNKNINYRMISNHELQYYNDENNSKNIFIKSFYNEDESDNIIFGKENNLFYFFDKYIQISYIKLIPIDNDIKNINNKEVYKIKEIKIFCENKIIFEGNIYNNKPTIILFTSENKLVKGINKNFLTKYVEDREIKEIETNTYYSLVLI